MESQLQLVVTSVGEMQSRMETLENSLDRRIEGSVNIWREESRSQTIRLEEQIREHNQALRDQMYQFVLMLTHQTQVSISLEFSPRGREGPILTGQGGQLRSEVVTGADMNPPLGEESVGMR